MGHRRLRNDSITKRSQDAKESLAMFQLQGDGGDEAVSSTALPTVLQKHALMTILRCGENTR
jgi:hypothetical protein